MNDFIACITALGLVGVAGIAACALILLARSRR